MQNTLFTAINSGRSTMKSEILNRIFGLVEDAAKKENEELVKILFWVHQKVKEMPTRIEDKPQAMLEEIEAMDN